MNLPHAWSVNIPSSQWQQTTIEIFVSGISLSLATTYDVTACIPENTAAILLKMTPLCLHRHSTIGRLKQLFQTVEQVCCLFWQLFLSILFNPLNTQSGTCSTRNHDTRRIQSCPFLCRERPTYPERHGYAPIFIVTNLSRDGLVTILVRAKLLTHTIRLRWQCRRGCSLSMLTILHTELNFQRTFL